MLVATTMRKKSAYNAARALYCFENQVIQLSASVSNGGDTDHGAVIFGRHFAAYKSQASNL